MRDRRLLGVVVALAVTGMAAGCGGGSAGGSGGARDGAGDPAPGAAGHRAGDPASGGSAGPGATADGADGPAGDGSSSTAPAAGSARATTGGPPPTRPAWLGTRVLNVAPGQAPPPTPPELDPRRLPTIDVLPPPGDGAFHAAVTAVPAAVAARSTWRPGCPVGLDDLRYVTVTFWGFDGEPHTGEMLVHRSAAEAVAGVFRRLFEDRFPIEDMHVTTAAELDAPDTGDGNATAAFVCRAARGGSRWSEHAYGLAVDINPFHNPYVRDGGVIPGLASSYLDRSRVRPGMLVPGGGSIEAFAGIGWEWGGGWTDPIDYMHFSAAGR